MHGHVCAGQGVASTASDQNQNEDEDIRPHCQLPERGDEGARGAHIRARIWLCMKSVGCWGP